MERAKGALADYRSRAVAQQQADGDRLRQAQEAQQRQAGLLAAAEAAAAAARGEKEQLAALLSATQQQLLQAQREASTLRLRQEHASLGAAPARVAAAPTATHSGAASEAGSDDRAGSSQAWSEADGDVFSDLPEIPSYRPLRASTSTFDSRGWQAKAAALRPLQRPAPAPSSKGQADRQGKELSLENARLRHQLAALKLSSAASSQSAGTAAAAPAAHGEDPLSKARQQVMQAKEFLRSVAGVQL